MQDKETITEKSPTMGGEEEREPAETTGEARQVGDESDRLQATEAHDSPSEDAAVATDNPAVGDENSRAAAPPAVGSEDWFRQDGVAFASAHPEVDMQSLFSDGNFLDYAEGKVGVAPLSAIYEGYRRLVDKLSAAHARTVAAREASPGSLRHAAPAAEGEFYTLAEMQAMSSDYIEQHWDKVQKSLAHLSK